MVHMFTDDEYWDIMQRRDARFDGVFYVGVHTTHIYCRPSCTARPLRKNVRFYVSSSAAQQAGLRACKRCHPDTISPEIRAIHTVCRYLETMPETPDLATIAMHAGYSTFHLIRLCKSHLGVTPKQYSVMLRRQRMRAALQRHESVGNATFDTGFNSLTAMYADAPLGMSPRIYRQGGRGMQLHMCTLPSPFGRLVIVTSIHGLCFVGFADDETDAQHIAHAEFPHAQLIVDSQASAIAQRVQSLLHTHPDHSDIPLDIKATAFQQRVWHALRAIPRGETRTYAQIAEAIAHPRAVRAVANACAHNPVALVIPCHRVTHQDAQRSGYRWSPSRKRAILAYEKEHAQTGGES